MPLSEAALPGLSKGELLSKLRHDLKTPLNQIIGYGEMLLEDAEAAQAESATHSLRKLVDAAQACLQAQAGTLQRPPDEVTASGWNELSADQVSRADLMQSVLTLLRSDPAVAECASDLERLEIAVGNLRSLAGSAPGIWEMAQQTGAVIPVAKPEPMAFVEDQGSPAEGAIEIPSGTSLGKLLVVDDNEVNRDMLSRRLVREGYSVALACNGLEALERLEMEAFDLVLLDIMMPELDGFAVLQRIRGNALWKETAVIMISALDEIASVVRCIEMGAEDYLPKPFDPVLLRARIGAILERKRLRDEERLRAEQMATALREVERQKQVSEAMLRNILPEKVATELRERGSVEPMYFEDVTICFTDFVGFTLSTERLAAEEIVGYLHEYFTVFDNICARYGVEKLKTIGDSYMFVSGMPERHPSHPVNAVLAALEMVEAVKKMARPADFVDWKIRVGVDTGPVIAGVVGIHKFAFDIWGDSVNFASRMESSGAPNRVNLSERTYARVKDFFDCEARGRVHTKDGREVDMFFANSVHEKLLDDRRTAPPPAFARRYRIYFQQEVKAFPEFLLHGGSGI